MTSSNLSSRDLDRAVELNREFVVFRLGHNNQRLYLTNSDLNSASRSNAVRFDSMSQAIRARQNEARLFPGLEWFIGELP